MTNRSDDQKESENKPLYYSIFVKQSTSCVLLEFQEHSSRSGTSDFISEMIPECLSDLNISL